eukprot:1147496-Pelagomonas_calceolata.AAC.1
MGMGVGRWLCEGQGAANQSGFPGQWIWNQKGAGWYPCYPGGGTGRGVLVMGQGGGGVAHD